MEKTDALVFAQLYREAYLQCFKQPLEQPISEIESKIFYNKVLEQTGLTIGARSLKNYSFYVTDVEIDKDENPSIATLDTLARYVLKSPYTNEINRKKGEGHHPYWFLYKTRWLEKGGTKRNNTKRIPYLAFTVILSLFIGFGGYSWYRHIQPGSITDNFERLGKTALEKRGWFILDKQESYWSKRNINKNALTLFTLPGDNWPDTAAQPSIKNLLIRRLPEGCFSAELQMENFFPAAEWQQAGLLLLTDSNLTSPIIRISLAYNDFFGGNNRPSEIIVQAISSPGDEGKPEEFIHYKVLNPDSAVLKPILFGNLKHTALRIEKQGTHYRFLYSGGFTVNEAFKELEAKDFIIQPRYIAIFALKGRVKNTPVIPVVIRKFILQKIS